MKSNLAIRVSWPEILKLEDVATRRPEEIEKLFSVDAAVKYGGFRNIYPVTVVLTGTSWADFSCSWTWLNTYLPIWLHVCYFTRLILQASQHCEPPAIFQNMIFLFLILSLPRFLTASILTGTAVNLSSAGCFLFLKWRAESRHFKIPPINKFFCNKLLNG